MEKYYINFKKDILWAGRFLNKENLSQLAQQRLVWRDVEHDVELLERLLGAKLGPQKSDDFIHRNISSTAFHLWRADKPISSQIMESGKIRRSLG